VGLGRSETGWDDDDNPPDATVSTQPVEVLGYKKVTFQKLAVPDLNGSLVWRNLKLREVEIADFAQKHNGMYPRWLYLRATITTTELPTSEYFRQVFIYTDLVPASGYSGFDELLPEQVEDPGNLFWIENIPQMWRLDNQIEDIAFLFEF